LLEKIPFKVYKGGVILIEATLDTITQPLNFILDTGSSGISLDSTTCQEFNIHPQKSDTSVSGIAGTRKVSYVFNQKFKTGNLVTDSISFYVNDYAILTSVYGEKVDGIIGFSFLSKYILEINFDSLFIKIYKPGTFNYDNGGTVLRPYFSRLVTATLDIKDKEKAEERFFIDTGAGLSLLLTEGFVKERKFLFSRRKPVVTQVQGLGGKRSMRMTVIKRLKVGPYVFKQVPTNLYEDEGNAIFYPSTVGLLGNDILRRFNMVLNYPQKEIFLKPNSNYADGFDYAYTGLTLFNHLGKIFVDDIVTNSPADKAGFKNGDIVLGVGVSFSGDIQTYEKLLQRPMESIKVCVKRDEKIFFIAITPVSIR
jgi:hypothetical protein